MQQQRTQIQYDRYFDMVLGGWIGKSLGGIVGAPFEAHKILGDMNAENCWPTEIAPNDDLDIQVVWLEMLEERGPNFTREDLADLWRDRCWYNFAEYGYFLYNEQRGIHAPLSGRFNNRFFRESMGCPIRAEIWGMTSPGNPSLAAEYAGMDGEQDHIDNSVWAEQFWAAAVSAAFFSDDMEDALDVGRSVIPIDAELYAISVLVPDLYQTIGDYKKIWKILIRKYGNRDCSIGLLNFAFTLLSLYVGQGDLKETIVTAINLGWYTDCTAATAAALVGVLKGGSAMPADWVSLMGDHLTCDVNVRRHKTSLLTEFAADTCKVGIEVALTRNPFVEITEIADDVRSDVETRKSNRPSPRSIAITSDYPEGPVLYRSEATPVTLRISYSGPGAKSGQLTLTAPEGISVSPSTTADSDRHCATG
jgi:ADP-ribosylglycohydrolase